MPEVIIILQNSTRPRTEFLIALLSHHARITRAALATSEIQDKVQDIAYDIQGHSWLALTYIMDLVSVKKKSP